MSALQAVFLGLLPLVAPQDPQPLPVETPPRPVETPAPQDTPPAPQDTPPAPQDTPPAPQDTPPAPVQESQPIPEARPARPAFAALARDARGRVDEQAFLGALDLLLAAAPGRLERFSIGKSRAGREITVLAVGERNGVERERRPAFFAALDPRSPFVTGTPGADAGAPASLIFLDWIAGLCLEPSESWTRFLRDNVLYLIVLPEPDRGLHGAADELGGEPAVELGRDFPHGWDPRSGAGSGQGPYPLSRNEARALATFLERRGNIACALLLAREGERPSPRGADEGALAAGTNVRKLGEQELAGLPASLERFAAREFLLPVLLLEVPRAGQLSTRDPASVLANLAGALPHLEAGPARVERLSNTTWMLDLPLRNSGFFATGGEGGRPGARPRSLWLRVEGARWISAAAKTGERAGFEELVLRTPPLFLEALGGGESCVVRVLLEAEENANVTLDFDSQRAGSVRMVVPLVSGVAGGK